MKHRLTALCLFALACSAFGAGAFDPFAQRVPCEVDQDGKAKQPELRTLRWIQGSTPLVQLDVINSGRQASGIDTTTVARMLIAPSGTGTYYAVTTNYTATNGAFLVQWPTVGTNTGTNVWWYTAYFERAGKRYWTGSGRLTIERTTSTDPDGLVWQTVTSGVWSDVVARASALAASNRAEAAYQLASVGGSGVDATARSSTVINASAILAVSNQAVTANATATNALSIVQALVAQGNINSNQAAALINSIASTGTYHYAETAGGIEYAGEGSSLVVIPSNGVLHVRTVTNGVDAVVVSTHGEGYNGPPAGTKWSSFVGLTTIDSGDWRLERKNNGTVEDPRIEVFLYSIPDNPSWYCSTPFPMYSPPFYMTLPYAGAQGSLIIDGNKLTNTFVIGEGVTNINGKSGAVIVLTAADVGAMPAFTNTLIMQGGKLGGTNGVYWTANTTNYWITFQ